MNAPEPCRLMRIHIGADDRFQGRTLYMEILDRCRQANIEMVTVYRGIAGYGASTRIHRPGLLGRSKDAPIVVTVLDTVEKIQGLLPMLNDIVDEGLIAISKAEVIRYGKVDSTHVRY